MDRKALTFFLVLLMLPTAVSTYNFNVFNQENAGITPDSFFYPLDTAVEETAMFLTFPLNVMHIDKLSSYNIEEEERMEEEQEIGAIINNIKNYLETFQKFFFYPNSKKVEMKLGQVQERGDEMNALFQDNSSEKTFKMEEKIIENLNELEKMAGYLEDEDTRERVSEKMSDYMRMSTSSTIYPNEVGYGIRTTSAKIFIETAEEPVGKVNRSLTVLNMYSNLSLDLMNLNLTYEAGKVLEDYNNTVGTLFQKFDEINGSKTRAIEEVGRNLGHHEKALTRSAPGTTKETAEKVFKNAVRQYSERFGKVEGEPENFFKLDPETVGLTN